MCCYESKSLGVCGGGYLYGWWHVIVGCAWDSESWLCYKRCVMACMILVVYDGDSMDNSGHGGGHGGGQC